MNFFSLCARVTSGEAPVVRTVLSGPEAGHCELLPCSAPLGRREEGGVVTYTERYLPAPKLVILGGGHVGKSLAQLGSFLDFAVEVIDPRPELLTPERFPGATVRIGEYANLPHLLAPEGNAYYVVTTSGHESDYLCVRYLLSLPFAYVGMLGSRSKVAQTRSRLLADGFTKSQVDALHAPIGLPISANTPEEIAVSIAAELIACRQTQGGAALSAPLLSALGAPDCQGILLTVTQKKGSAPRGPGSKLLLLSSGQVVGTIGGGSVEFRALEHAKRLDSFDVQTYSLSPDAPKSLGICGGTVEVMFQPVRPEQGASFLEGARKSDTMIQPEFISNTIS